MSEALLVVGSGLRVLALLVLPVGDQQGLVVADDALVDGLLHEHAELAQGAVLEGLLGVELDVLDAAVPAAADLRVVLKVAIDQLDELLPLEGALTELAQVLVVPLDGREVVCLAVEDVAVLAVEGLDQQTGDVAHGVHLQPVVFVLVGGQVFHDVVPELGVHLDVEGFLKPREDELLGRRHQVLLNRPNHPVQDLNADGVQQQGHVLNLGLADVAVEGPQHALLEVLAVLLSDHEGALGGQIPVVVLDAAALVALHAGEGVKVEQGRLALPLPEGVLGGGGHVDGEVVAGLAGVLGADVALAVEAVVLQANAGHGDVGDVVHRLLHHLAQPVQGGLDLLGLLDAVVQLAGPVRLYEYDLLQEGVQGLGDDAELVIKLGLGVEAAHDDRYFVLDVVCFLGLLQH